MEYRKILKTGWEVSAIGLGLEHLDGKPYTQVEETVHAALDLGVNIMDVFMPGEEIRTYAGRALKGKRDRVFIQGHIGSTDISEQYDVSRDLPTCQKYFENLLRFLQTDYIDLGMLFFINTEQDFKDMFESDILEYAHRLKKEGKIRALGASSHDPLVARKIVETGEVDLLMFSANPAFDMMPSMDMDDMLEDDVIADAAGVEPTRGELYRVCERDQVAITVMKTLGAGKLLSPEHTPFDEPLTVAQCVHYALERPAVVSALLGCASADEMKHAIEYFSLPDEKKEYSRIIGSKKGNFEGSCMYCNHCQPCPQEIDIAAVTKYLDIARLDEKNIPPSIASHYKELTAHGSDCIECGSCEERCPFQVGVIGNMNKAGELFGE